MQSWTKTKGIFFLFFIPVFVWMILFFMLPMANLGLYSLSSKTHTSAWTLHNYMRAFHPVYIKIFIYSTLIALITTAVTFALSLPIAIAISLSSPRIRPWLLFLVILPFWTNMLIRTYAFIIILRIHGLVNIILEKAASFLHLPFAPLHLLYTQGAVVLGLVYISLPLMIFPLYLQLEKLDHSYLEASSDLGSGPIRTFFKITLPLIAPGAMSGIILTFTSNLGAYLVPDLLGGTKGIMISNIISMQFKTVNDWPFGSALGFILISLTFVFVLTKSLLLRNRAS